MNTISAKFSDDDHEKLNQICESLQIDKSEALRRSVQQAWLALQLGRTFLERAGGHPKHLLNADKPAGSDKASRRKEISKYLEEKLEKQKKYREQLKKRINDRSSNNGLANN